MKNFKWGVNGHNFRYPAYPSEKLDDQLRYAAELGMGYYRINYSPRTEQDFEYSDKLTETADKYKLKIFLVIFDMCLYNKSHAEDLYKFSFNIAKRYRGKIPMYQISNEQDIPALDLVNLKDPIGDKREHYDLIKYSLIRENMAAIIKGIKDGDPDAETVVNFSWRHCYFLDMLMEDSLMWDSTAIDWYSDLYDGNLAPTMEHVLKHPQKSFYVAEGNTWEGDYRFTEKEQLDYTVDAMNYFYNYPNEKVKGYMIYQLLDEPDKEKGEAHFGLLLNDIKGNIGRKKSAYYGVAEYIKNTSR
jgi:hypothetical protein